VTTDAVLERFSRRTSGARYIPEIDGLRFVSIALVLLYHVTLIVGLLQGTRSIRGPFGSITSLRGAAGLPIRLLEQGQFGVDIFFVVSGFVLALPFISAKVLGGPAVDLRRYFARRVTRIEAPYLIVLTLFFVGLALAGAAVGWGHYLAGILYSHGSMFGVENPINGVTWSLETEVQFYVCVPLLALILTKGGRRTRRMTILLVAAAAIMAEFGGLVDNRFLATLGGYLQFFMVGWLLADIYLVDWHRDPSTDRRWDLVSLAGWPLLLVGLVEVPPFQRVFAPWLVLALCFAVFRGPITRRIFANRWLTTLGGMCYSIYLLHYVLMIVMGRSIAVIRTGSSTLDVLVYAVILIPPVLVVSALFFLAIERPCMNPAWPARLIERWRKAVALIRPRVPLPEPADAAPRG
jgi:peptidoglycan/LPS O-acetylase OafA/YrhL